MHYIDSKQEIKKENIKHSRVDAQNRGKSVKNRFNLI